MIGRWCNVKAIQLKCKLPSKKKIGAFITLAKAVQWIDRWIEIECEKCKQSTNAKSKLMVLKKRLETISTNLASRALTSSFSDHPERVKFHLSDKELSGVGSVLSESLNTSLLADSNFAPCLQN